MGHDLPYVRANGLYHLLYIYLFIIDHIDHIDHCLYINNLHVRFMGYRWDMWSNNNLDNGGFLC